MSVQAGPIGLSEIFAALQIHPEMGATILDISVRTPCLPELFKNPNLVHGEMNYVDNCTRRAYKVEFTIEDVTWPDEQPNRPRCQGEP